MKKIKLTQGKFALVDDEDFEWLNQWKWSFDNRGYARRGKGILMHRIILSTPKNKQTDHINMNRLDNRKENLRFCNAQQNQFNIKNWKNNTSGHRGIIFDKESNKWRVRIGINGKKIHVGRFLDLNEAVEAYKNASRKYYGGFSYL